MSACTDCAALIRDYGAPDRSCDQCWQEDHPNGFRIKVNITDIHPDTFRLLFPDVEPKPVRNPEQQVLDAIAELEATERDAIDDIVLWQLEQGRRRGEHLRDCAHPHIISEGMNNTVDGLGFLYRCTGCQTRVTLYRSAGEQVPTLPEVHSALAL